MIKYKTEEEIAIMREGGKIHARILKELAKKVKPGVKTDALNTYAEELIDEAGCTASFLGYQPYDAKEPYPAALCVSINEEIVHGIPNEGGCILFEGDIVSLDLGLTYKNLITDAAITLPVGKISKEAEMLIRATKEALNRGIKAMRLHGHIGDIGDAIMQIAMKYEFGIIEGLSGHGVGYSVHEEPFVPNRALRGEGPELKEGLVIAIEPMFSLGSRDIKRLSDGYTFVTRDKSLSAHFEHTVAVTKAGIEVLTKL
ncbi:MAG: type I methionyl aminopeptidase [Candidatus Zambryskibacteria bacterium RIFCSPHIGHO2_12_FULL_38_34]|uniref:Methionine aminopeptidase n=1 Tax=Candidatus Zambryskibacteria bacterium RIFCSPLOWO2_12_FULL_39_16 TaxID=1802775 RepID=A0A1G2URT0_9BACT|nr:MAG: type I methionyl aminopeptidase [Candidatus Zambryskibacteria bacterium RIFCSPHIGHO2_02_FULL_38_22]OHA98392.1 MAG: type I methionyl aminopeptidase [Candidatus Zambryskibacteria bacterium RIFCSPHIGHO2_12_FULL_38_34]OHB08009.1 MAG: type I methionyl aminopeptidase [Candidatus Zambryskibacteria bacterium RIFCSPLOWO2_02_FULL_38_13]OHB12073.1 MAG: type I methionyl aminopeptidase [Candidatus Zambryskibacteria bacterium RIFCSPLOWO2_12_FULL_39_16]